jgi:hypothetical protein
MAARLANEGKRQALGKLNRLVVRSRGREGLLGDGGGVDLDLAEAELSVAKHELVVVLEISSALLWQSDSIEISAILTEVL